MNTKTKSLISEETILEYLKTLESPEGIIYASDTKFHRLFGRDSIITSLEFLPWFPDYAKNTIKALIEHQNENGQIIHETYKRNTMWDSLDSSPLFIILIYEYFLQTRDIDFIKKVIASVEKSFDWIEKKGDNNKDGYLEYWENKKGLAHHCWKDSCDGITDENDNIPKYPISPVEVQGYFYKALISLSEISKILGKDDSNEYEKRASSLKKSCNKDFWMEDEGFFCIALDGDKKQVKTISSNVGHLLWSGIIDEEKIKKVVKRILKDDISTIYGVRTLSSEMGNFDAFSYHNGSIWPFDNWFLAEGLEKYGYKKEANSLREKVLLALENLGNPLECYTFFDSKLGVKMITWDKKDLYPEKIQAWTLGAMYSFLKKLKRP